MSKIVNVKNLKKDYQDPDLGAYGKNMPIVNKAVMKVSLATRTTPKKAMQASTYARQFDNKKFQTNPLLKVSTPKQNFTKKKMPQKPTMKQYGDKGYKPSDGTGVGY
jgi:hypothetical protein